MKSIKLMITVMLLAMTASNSVWAGHRGGHAHFGAHVVIGPVWGPWWYPPPRYYYPPYPYYPPLVVERAAAPVYIEQPAAPPPPAAPMQPQANYWYYCDAVKGYYPYVKECPSGWQRVLPLPPGQP